MVVYHGCVPLMCTADLYHLCVPRICTVGLWHTTIAPRCPGQEGLRKTTHDCPPPPLPRCPGQEGLSNSTHNCPPPPPGVLSEEELGNKLYVYELGMEYASHILNLRSYDATSRDIMQRWAYPFVPDVNVLYKGGPWGPSSYRWAGGGGAIPTGVCACIYGMVERRSTIAVYPHAWHSTTPVLHVAASSTQA